MRRVLDETKIHFLPLSQATIEAYVDSGEAYGKAGAFGVQGAAGSFISRIEGCFYSVWGFPLSGFAQEIAKMVEEGAIKL